MLTTLYFATINFKHSSLSVINRICKYEDLFEILKNTDILGFDVNSQIRHYGFNNQYEDNTQNKYSINLLTLLDGIGF